MSGPGPCIEQDEVTVVIPARGRPDLLERAARSVLGQSHAPAEVLIVDDGSESPLEACLPDDVVERCRVIRYTPGEGAAQARNKGLQESASPWVAFIDADDWWDPDHLAAAVRVALVHKVAGVVGAYQAVFSSGPTVAYRSPRESGPIDEFAEYMFVEGGLCRTSTFLVARKPGVDTSFDPGVRHEDWDFMLRMARTAKVAYNNALTAKVDHSASGRFSQTRNVKASLEFLAKHRTEFTRLQRNGFRLRVARSAGMRAQRHVVNALLSDLEPPISAQQRVHGCVSRVLGVHPVVTRAARSGYLLWRRASGGEGPGTPRVNSTFLAGRVSPVGDTENQCDEGHDRE